MWYVILERESYCCLWCCLKPDRKRPFWESIKFPAVALKRIIILSIFIFIARFYIVIRTLFLMTMVFIGFYHLFALLIAFSIDLKFRKLYNEIWLASFNSFHVFFEESKKKLKSFLLLPERLGTENFLITCCKYCKCACSDVFLFRSCPRKIFYKWKPALKSAEMLKWFKELVKSIYLSNLC